MVKRFFQALIKAGLLILLMVLVVINMWQNNRMEAKQIQILSQLEKLERRMGSGVNIAQSSSNRIMEQTSTKLH